MWDSLLETEMETRKARTKKRLDRCCNRVKILLNQSTAELVRRQRQRRENEQSEEDQLTSTSAHVHQTASPTLAAFLHATTPTADATGNVCLDIRGKSRACCNSALRCFDDLRTTVDELDNTQNDFQLLSVCRRISGDLRKDKLCVKRSVSRCNGPGRVILQRRFDTKIANLYDHFYKHCRRTPPPPLPPRTTTTVGPNPPRTEPPVNTGIPPKFWPPTTHHDPTHGLPADPAAASSATSTAIIAGAIAGGVLLLAVIILFMVIWCRSMMKRDTYSNGSAGTTSGGSLGMFFQRRPNMFSTERPQPPTRDNKTVKRQESSEYAEIDDSFMTSQYQPEVAPRPISMANVGYIHPIGDRAPVVYPPSPLTPPFATSTLSHPGANSSATPFPMTRGQLAYGPILAANANNQQLFYQSNEIRTPQMMNDYELPTLPTQGSETILSPQNLQNVKLSHADSTHDTSGDTANLDESEYEEPVSVHSSNHYSRLDSNDSGAPYELAPVVPKTPDRTSSADTNKPDIPPKVPKLPENYSAPMKSRPRPKPAGVKVLPSTARVIGPPSPEQASPVSPPKTSAVAPVAKPRLKRNVNEDKDTVDIKPSSNNEAGKDVTGKPNMPLSARDSNLSTQSSHHYFVLEPETSA